MKKMHTLPLQPVFDNSKFQDLFPGARYYVVEAIYLLSQKGKLILPLPDNIKTYFLCSLSLYNRNKTIFMEILRETIPEILEIKKPIEIRQQKIANALSRRAARKRLEKNAHNVFSDERDTHNEIIPVLSPSGINQYNKGRFDPIERAKAIDANATGKEKMFTDN